MKILKQFIIIVLLFLLHLTAFSQQQISFNRIYNPDSIYTVTPNAHTVLTNNNNYIIQAYSYKTSIGPENLMFLELDSIGNIIKEVSLNPDSTTAYVSGFGSFIHTHDSGYCYVGNMHTSVNKYHYFVKLNNNLDTLWTSKIQQPDTLDECDYQLRETYDKSFVMVGSKSAGVSLTDVLLLKVDSLGNQMWKKTIATGNLSVGYQIKETPDKGLLICGYKTPPYSNIYTGGPFILKTDSAGNLIWSSFPNSQQYNGLGAIAITPEGNYLFAYGYGISLEYSNSTDYYYSRINVITYDANGGVIWNRFYDNVRLNQNIYKVEMLPNGDYFILGNYYVADTNTYQSEDVALLMKIDSKGDSLWTKSYGYAVGPFGDSNELFDGVATNDGGFISCGLEIAYPIVPQQMMWVVKTDSNGYAPGMNSLGVNEVNKGNKGEVRIFPNPATNHTTIAYPQLKEEGDIQIYNILGQIVYKEKLVKGSSQTKLSIQHLKAGLYKVIAREKGIIKGEVSLVKE